MPALEDSHIYQYFNDLENSAENLDSLIRQPAAELATPSLVDS